jgi:hypothetical protein
VPKQPGKPHKRKLIGDDPDQWTDEEFAIIQAEDEKTSEMAWQEYLRNTGKTAEEATVSHEDKRSPKSAPPDRPSESQSSSS